LIVSSPAGQLFACPYAYPLVWGGIAAFAASGSVSAFIDLAPVVKMLLYPLMFASWGIAACGMVGYVRWFFGEASAEARKMYSLRQKD
jgi:hypothetical protein